MTKVSARRMAGVLFLFLAATAIASPAQRFNTLVNFDGADGDEPNPPYLLQGTDGGLYGTTETSGAGGSGTIFKLTRRGGLNTLYSFSCDQNSCGGGAPTGLTFAANGLLYGTTYGGGNSNCSGGCGTVFQMTKGGLLTILHNFAPTDGNHPAAGVIEAIDENFYGTTVAGGANGIGTVFKISSEGALTILHSFGRTDGASPVSGLIQATDGNFYGTTAFGGSGAACSAGCGTVFKITRKGVLTTLYNFCVQTDCADGAEPMSALFQGVDGNFYGTTYYGGNSTCDGGCGTVFTISASGAFTTLYSFCSLPSCADGVYPRAGVVVATDGNLYGTTSAGATNALGTAFSLDSAGTLSILHTFDPSDGGEPFSGLLQATNGSFYGTTYYGGRHNQGTLFSLDTGLGPFVTFVRLAGKVGQTGPILGQGFTGTTSVLLNGTPVTFTVVSDTYIRSTVPPGATSGYVTVTTPSGTLTSNVPFHVIH